jgi:outer membrane protein W
MKKIAFLAVCFVMLALSSNAQKATFKPFKFDIAVGYASPSGGGGAKGGVLFAFEPKYALNDKIAVGLRMEAALMVRANPYGLEEDEFEGDVKASGSYLATADYYFNANDFRPFAGIGAGLYRTATAAISSTIDENDVATGNKFGFAPRAGFEYKHFRMALEYNIAGKTGIVNNNYLGVKFGFFIGGGRVK